MLSKCVWVSVLVNCQKIEYGKLESYELGEYCERNKAERNGYHMVVGWDIPSHTFNLDGGKLSQHKEIKRYYLGKNYKEAMRTIKAYRDKGFFMFIPKAQQLIVNSAQYHHMQANKDFFYMDCGKKDES